MSDLISRSKVISILQQLNEHSLSGKMDIDNAIYLLENQPTAYSADNVIKQLDEYITKIVGRKSALYQTIMQIVKQGGVSDDVCEYFVKCEEIYAGCNKKAAASAFCWFNECGDYKYCPYCGKKIKVADSNDV